MGAERGLRQRIRAAIRYENPDALIVGQPANGMTGPGRHDLYVVVVGRFVGLEVKTSTGRATQIQLGRIRDTRRAGGYAWLVRSTKAACWAVRLARTGALVAEDADFDIDSLLASFRPDDPKDKPWPEEQALSGEDPQDLDREIAGFKPSQALSEEHIASAAQANGTAAGDGEALGEAQTPMSVLAQAINDLTAAVRDLRITAEQLKTTQASRAVYGHPEHPVTTDSEEEKEPDRSAEFAELQALLDGTAILPEPEPTAPPSPPSKPRRRRAQ